MAEGGGIGLQNRAQQFDSAWYLLKDVIRTLRVTFSVFVPLHVKSAVEREQSAALLH